MSFTGILLAGGKSSRFKFNKLNIKVDYVPLFIDQIFKLSFFCKEILISTSKNNSYIISSHLAKINKYLDHFKKIFELSFIKKMNLKNIFSGSFKIPEIKIIEDDCADIFDNITKNIFVANKDYDNIFGEAATGKRSDNNTSSPMLGIYSGLKSASYPYSLVLAFDMPFVSYRLFKMLEEFIIRDCIERHGGSQEYSFRKQNFKVQKTEKTKDAYIVKTEKGFEVLSGLYSKNCIDSVRENIKKEDYKISDIFSTLNVEIIDESWLRLKNIDNLNFFNINKIEHYHQFSRIWKNGTLNFKEFKNEGKLPQSFSGMVKTFLEKWVSFYFR